MKRGKTKSKTLKQAIALNEILMFILSSFAFAFIISLSLGGVGTDEINYGGMSQKWDLSP